MKIIEEYRIKTAEERFYQFCLVFFNDSETFKITNDSELLIVHNRFLIGLVNLLSHIVRQIERFNSIWNRKTSEGIITIEENKDQHKTTFKNKLIIFIVSILPTKTKIFASTYTALIFYFIHRLIKFGFP